MLVKSNPQEEKINIQHLIEEDDALKLQHELFLEEMKFKQQLINARKEKELTQKEISEKSGLSQQAVSRLEKGHGGTIDTVVKYLHAMGMKLTICDY